MEAPEPGGPIVLGARDWERLAELRAAFLRASAPRADGELEPRAGSLTSDYWRDRRDFEIYDATLGARIGWKWRAVLAEVARRAPPPPAGLVLDWGTGSGVAARAWLAAFGASGSWRFWLHDRSPLALEHARASLRAAQPAVSVETGLDPGSAAVAPDVLLVSHVLGELDPATRAELAGLARRTPFVVWVEAGARAPSRALSALRESLLETHVPRAPCTHAAACGALANERDWCHLFAAPDPESFTSAHWARVGRTLGIDLRSLPYAYLVLTRRTGPAEEDDPSRARFLGRPSFSRGRVQLYACRPAGYAEVDLLERTDRKLFRALEGPSAANGVYRIELAGSRIQALQPV